MKQKTIWHVGGWNRNYGDFAIQAGLRRMLRQETSAPLAFVSVDCQRTWFHPALIDRLNEEADLLLVGGGGMIFHRPEDASHSGWQFNIRAEDLNRIAVPLVVYGIGYNRFHYDLGEFKPQMNEHLRCTQAKAALFSVRNAGTREELVRRGLDAGAIEVIPDPGMFTPPSPIELPGPDPEGPTIALNWAGDRVEQRWPDPAETTAQATAASLAEALAAVLAERGGRVLWTPHIVDIDRHMFSVFQDRLGAALIDIERDLAAIYPPSAYQVPFLTEVYRRCDLVIGMRGHANIVPFGMGTPVIALGSHAKNRFFLHEIGEPWAYVDVRGYPDGCSATAMKALIDRALDDAALPARLQAALVCCTDQARAFNRKLLDLIAA